MWSFIIKFHFAHPEIKTRINYIYNSPFSGSVLWNLNGRTFAMLKNSWSVSVRRMWELPHRFFMEALGGTNAWTMLFSRFTSFIQSLMRSQKPAVILIFLKICQNVNSVTGHNIRYILNETKNDDILKINVKKLKR